VTYALEIRGHAKHKRFYNSFHFFKKNIAATMLAHTRQFACLHRLLCPQKVMDVPSLCRQYQRARRHAVSLSARNVVICSTVLTPWDCCRGWGGRWRVQTFEVERSVKYKVEGTIGYTFPPDFLLPLCYS
jgi:hypothetical protein